MSVLVAALLAAGSAAAAAFLARRARSARGAPGRTTETAEATETEEAAEAAADRERLRAAEREVGLDEPPPLVDDGLEGFRCRVGDVLLRRQGDEAWLGGALVLEEERPALALFVSPAEKRAVVIAASPRPVRELWWLREASLDAPLPPGDLPAVLELAGLRYERTRRRPLGARAVGEGAPDLAGDVVVGEYRGPSRERLVVVRPPAGEPRVYAGEELLEGSFEVVPSGVAGARD